MCQGAASEKDDEEEECSDEMHHHDGRCCDIFVSIKMDNCNIEYQGRFSFLVPFSVILVLVAAMCTYIYSLVGLANL